MATIESFVRTSLSNSKTKLERPFRILGLSLGLKPNLELGIYLGILRFV